MPPGNRTRRTARQVATPLVAAEPAPSGLAVDPPRAARSPAGSTTQPVTIDVSVPGGRADVASLKRALEAIAPFVANATLEREDEAFREVVDRIIESTPIRRLDAVRAALEQRAIAALFVGTQWLSAEQIGRLRDPHARNPHAAANRWRTERKVFAVSKGGVQWFPRYAFDEALDPHPAVARVMAVLDGWSPYRLATWFESTNGHLGGRRPRDVVQAEPDAVVAAAREHVRGPVHG
jgi:hypothetical protein